MSRATLLLALALAGCSSSSGLDFDRSDHDPIPPVETLDYARLTPAEEWDRWELRLDAVGGVVDGVVGGGGPLLRDELEPEARAAFVAVAPQAGFAWGCDGGCFKYVAAVRDGVVSTFTTVPALRTFLGERADLVEVVILLDALGFHWDEGTDTGWRPADGGWELVAFEMTASCAPIVIDRVRVFVGVTGDVAELAREEWRRLEDVCT